MLGSDTGVSSPIVEIPLPDTETWSSMLCVWKGSCDEEVRSLVLSAIPAGDSDVSACDCRDFKLEGGEG